MNIDYWKDRWDTGATGFHEGKPNELLVEHIGLLAGKARVLVPLAGKTVDMMFLAQPGLGHSVVGVEGVESACVGFFHDNGLPLVIEERDRFRAHCGGGIELLCGDFFDATPARVGQCDAVYDRAALIALDPAVRVRYVDTLRALLKPGGRILLVTLVYDQSKLAGPPFSVDRSDVAALYQDGFKIELVTSRPGVPMPKQVDAGVTDLREDLFLITRT